MTKEEYIKRSLELHLFFNRIMKEHSFFLEAAFMEKDAEFKRIANDFQNGFSDILEEAIRLADGNISQEFLNSEEIVTKNTLQAEMQSSTLSGIGIRTNITEKELKLKSGNTYATEDLVNHISNINRRVLPMIENLIDFKNNILNQVLSCKMYTANYPLLITHIMNEARMYYNLLKRVESKQLFTDDYIYEQELFWNNIMKEHAQFIRGLLDPSENELILTADRYADEYNNIMKNYGNNPLYLLNTSLKETIDFRTFKLAGEEGILACKIKSIIIPLLADHVLREANHFIRILRNGAQANSVNTY